MRRMSPPRAPLALLLALLLASLAPRADAQMSGMTGQPLVADLSAHEISITTGFSGTELLLFGATEGEGDVIVVIRGPGGDWRRLYSARSTSATTRRTTSTS